MLLMIVFLFAADAAGVMDMSGLLAGQPVPGERALRLASHSTDEHAASAEAPVLPPALARERC